LICDDVKVLVLSVASGCTCVTFIFAAQGDPLAACLLVQAELGPQRFPFEVTTACAHQVHTVRTEVVIQKTPLVSFVFVSFSFFFGKPWQGKSHKCHCTR
jgi:hypothetical protein